MEFAHRFLAHHYRAKFYPEALVYHPVRTIGWHGIWKRLFMLRWSALYCYKIDKGLHLSDSRAKNLLSALKHMPMGELRNSWHDLQRWNAPKWRTPLVLVRRTLARLPADARVLPLLGRSLLPTA